MRELKFVYIVIVLFLQSCIVLHSSIVSYVEQRYHNFSDFHSNLGKTVANVYENTMLKDIWIFNKTLIISNALERVRVIIFEPKINPHKQASIKRDTKHNVKIKDKNPHKIIKQTSPTLTTPTNTQNIAQNAPQNVDDIESAPQQIPLKPKTPTESHKLDSEPSTNTHNTTHPPANNQAIDEIDIKKPSVNHVQNPTIIVDENTSVLLIGDSMMQGVAPYLMKRLKKLHLFCINLSKHSTGLTYKHYFDWEEALQEAFNMYENIGLVVVLLGANDPWNMKSGVKFKTDKWENIYLERIGEIIHIAQSYGAKVAWYEVPFVQEETLNQKIIYLNSLYKRAIEEYGEYFFQSNGIITQDYRYSAFIKDKNGKNIHVRGDDGVHFTAKGYQIMANIMINNMLVLPIERTLDTNENIQSIQSIKTTPSQD